MPADSARAEQLPSRRELSRSARAAESWRVVYCPGEATSEGDWQQLLSGMAAARPFDKPIEVLHCDSIANLSELAGRPLIFAGTRLPDLAMPGVDYLPVEVREGGGFRVFDEEFTDPRDRLLLSYVPSPADPRQAFHFWFGNSDSFLLESLRDDFADEWSRAFWGGWGYRVTRAGHTRFQGFLDETTWQWRADQHFAFTTEPEFLGRSAHYEYYAWDEAPTPQLPEVQARLEADYERVAAFTGRTAAEPARVYFYPSIERMGLRRDDMSEAQYSAADRSLHLVCNPAFKGEQRGHQISLWLEIWLGETTAPWLRDGLTAHLTPSWAGGGATYWAARLRQSDNLPPLAKLFAPDRNSLLSPLVRSATAGALVDLLLATRGRAYVLERYGDWDPAAAETRDLNRELDRYLAARPVALPPRRPLPADFLRGMTFAHEGYRVFNGYGGSTAKASLDSLAELGVNAVSIVPYGSMRNAGDLQPFLREHGAGGENDQAVLSSALYADAKGWFVLMKPQIWVRGSWPGGIEFDDPAEWDRFHEYYYQWILHYALLSEIYQLDGLCLGTEFVQATLQYPDQWREMAGKIRGLYRGVLTYAANWGQEFEQFAIWDAFDAAGLNAYYPLGQTPQVTDDSLTLAARRMLEQAAAIAARHDKPLWLTEIGYRSVTSPWINPHAEPEGRPAAAEDQARAYRALLRAQAETGASQAIFWWKWPSYLGYTQPDDTGYAVRAKPGAEVLRRYWKR